MAKPSLDSGLGLMCLGVRKPEVPLSTRNGGAFILEKMTQSAPNGYTTCDFCVSFSLYCIFCHKMEALAQTNTKITRYSHPNFRSCSNNSSQSWGR